MADLISEGMSWLSDQLKTQAATAITYRRGAWEVTLQATLGTQLLRVSDDFGASRVQWTDRDFIINADDLKLQGVKTEPERGDEILMTVDGELLTFKVAAPNLEAVFRYSDSHRKRIRIHTNFIKAEAV